MAAYFANVVLGLVVILLIIVVYAVIIVLIKKGDRKMAAKRGVGGEARQAAHSKRHKRAMKLCLYLLLVYLISYTPLYMLPYFDKSMAHYIGALYFFNHFGNFFIYCATDKKFRVKGKSVSVSILSCCKSQ